MKFDSKCHLSTKLFAEHSKIASQPINWKVNKCHFVVLVVNKCHFVVLVVNKCHFVVLVVNKCHFVVLVVNKCHFVVLVVRKRSRNDFTLLKRVLKLCNNVANYGTKSHIHGSASTVTYRRPPSKLWRIACNVDPKSIIAFHFHLWSTKGLSLETFVWNKYVYLYTNRFIEKLSSSSSNFWWTNTSITNGRCNFIDAQLLIFRGRFLKLFGYFLRKISY